MRLDLEIEEKKAILFRVTPKSEEFILMFGGIV